MLALLIGSASAAAQDAPQGATPEAAPQGEEANAATDGELPKKPDASVDRYRNPVQAMTEHFLGSTARPVRFDWRNSPVAFGFIGGELLERNNFGSFRTGGLVRRAVADFMLELAVNWVFVLPTQSSELLALTPYEQAGRPQRIEVDFNAGYPLAEAVVTPVFAWVPPAELVFSATGGFRYLIYWEGFRAFQDRNALDIGGAIASPFLTEDERIEIERTAPGGMLVDYGRYHVMGGLALDVYFQPGVFISPRANLAIPLLAAVSATRLGLWWETSIVLGFAL
jgi:hypothetical protein